MRTSREILADAARIGYDALSGGGFLSMGMTDSYEEALACGANLIRPGSAIFGKRQYGQEAGRA